jgi:septal ring factor EnvC (AmiA/AmiB activator)
MSQSASGQDPDDQLERSADELEHDLHKLEDHISDAEQAAKARREEAEAPGETVAGDWEDTRGTPSQGEDPEGAFDDEGSADREG